MERNFHCPFCHGQLFVNQRVILSAATDDEQRGLVLFTQELGDYKALTHSSFKIKEGHHVDFFCPICHNNLIVEKKTEKFTRIMMVELGEEYEVLFSQIAGEKSTYVIGENSIRSYGKDAHEFTNFWGETPNY